MPQYTQMLVFLLILTSCTHQTTYDESSGQPLHNAECIEGTIRHGYTSNQTFGGMPCVQGMQTCFAGKWTGPQLYESCEIFNKSCDGHPDGSIERGYLTPIGPCIEDSRRCDNGNWVGTSTYLYPSCTELPSN